MELDEASSHALGAIFTLALYADEVRFAMLLVHTHILYRRLY